MIGLLAGLAGGVGALVRVEVALALAARRPAAPWGTRVVNVVGAGLLALVLGLDPGQDVTTVLGTGFLGGFTTFSTWMVEATEPGLAAHGRELVVPVLVGLAVVATVRAAVG